jgi:hypothetical protein
VARVGSVRSTITTPAGGHLGAAAVHLAPDDLREIDRAAAEIAIHGARYTDRMQKMVGR